MPFDEKVSSLSLPMFFLPAKSKHTTRSVFRVSFVTSVITSVNCSVTSSEINYHDNVL